MAPFWEMKGISKSFVGVRALDDVSFSCEKGEVHVLLGENGAGKSTLLKILTGFYPKDAGEIRIAGQRVNFHNTSDSRKAGVAMVYQELSILPHLNVTQNVFLNAEKKNGLTRFGLTLEKAMHNRVEELSQHYGIEVDPYALAGDLPVAKQQMVEILKVLVQEPEIIVLDEPTSAIAREEVDKLFEIVMKLKEDGKSIIFISHRLEEVFRFGSRVTVLKDGQVVETTALDNLSEEDLVCMMVGRELKDIFPQKCAQAGAILFEVKHMNVPGVLHDINLQVREGEILGIAGLQGHGQGELLSAVAGVIHRTGGEFLLGGKPLKIRNPADAIAQGISYIPEDRKVQGLMLGLSVRDNLTISSLRARCTLPSVICRRAEREFVNDSIQEMKIRTPNAMQYVERLSGGNQQKVVLGKGLATKPAILLFNEPTRGIDVGAKQEVYRMMRRLSDDGVAVIMYSSDLLEIVGLSDRVLAMYEGRIISEISAEKITEEAVMMASMGLATKEAV